MKLDAEKQQLLIQLATAHTQLRHVDDAACLTERAAVDELIARRGALRDRRAHAMLAREDTQREIHRLEEDELRLQKRVKDDQARLSAVTDSSQRRELTHDLEQATRRLDKIRATIAELRADDHDGGDIDELATIDAELDAARRALKDAEATVAAARAEREHAIAAIAAELPADIVEEFTTQQRLTGVGAVVLSSRTCHGCSMVLSPAELASIADVPADHIARCPQCGTLLVRSR